MSFSNCSSARLLGFKRYTTDFAIALEGDLLLLENKNLVLLGTSTGKGYDPLPPDIGTWPQKQRNTSMNMQKYLILLAWIHHIILLSHKTSSI